MDCLFCKIASGEINSYTVYEDEIIKVFLDIDPNTKGHMLVIPKQHYLDINNIDLDVLKHINDVSKDMYKLLEKTFNVDGITIAQNNGCAQDVKHFHMHLIPRYLDDGIKHVYPHKSDISLEETFKNISDNLNK